MLLAFFLFISLLLSNLGDGFSCSKLYFPQIFTLSSIPHVLHDNPTTIVTGPSHTMLQFWSHVVTLYSCDAPSHMRLPFIQTSSLRRLPHGYPLHAIHLRYTLAINMWIHIGECAHDV